MLDVNVATLQGTKLLHYLVKHAYLPF